jgi:hypothetical protein
LRILTKYPYVYDLLKYDVLKFEFHLHENDKKYKEDRYMGCLAGMVGELVRLGQLDAKNETIYLSGYLGPDDY